MRPSSGACQYAYYSGDWEAVEYHLADDVFAGVFPTHGGEACVWAISTESLARRYRRGHRAPDDSLAAVLTDHVPGLAARLAAEDQRSPVRGMLRMPNHFRKPFGAGWSLVGDAGYHRDAITGHGISDALRDAELLAQAVDTSLRCPSLEVAALAAYEFHRDRMSARIFEITVALAAFPKQETFVALQRDLAVAIDDLAGELHSRPLPRAADAHVAVQTPAGPIAPGRGTPPEIQRTTGIPPATQERAVSCQPTRHRPSHTATAWTHQPSSRPSTP